jgi:glycosyltransferase involved in cell wall biosynthesis
MHVLIIPSERYLSPEEPLSGIFQRDQARALKRAGLKVGIVAPAHRSLRWLRVRVRGWPRGIEIVEDEGIPVYRSQAWRWIPGRVPYLGGQLILSVGKKLFTLYVHDNGLPDLVHAHNSLYAGVLAARLKQDYGVPFVLTEHSSAYLTNGFQGWQRLLIRHVLERSSARIVVSKHLGKVIEQLFPEVASPWEWVPNILDPLFEYQNALEEEIPSSREPFCFLTVGNLVWVKGHEILLKAFAWVFKGKHHVYLRIGGDGPLRGKLERLCHHLGIKDQVKFLGQLTREQVLAEMRRCDAFVLPSFYETFGVVLIEALACGKPVIATACGGPEEIVNSANGILVPPGDKVALGRAMLQMLDSIGSYEREIIRQHCLNLFGEATVVSRLRKVYEHVLGAREG